MDIPTQDQNDIASTDTDTDGPCIIAWLRDPGVQCDGWIAGGILFAPRDGQAVPGTWIYQGEPDPSAGWYDVATGVPATMLDGLPHRLVDAL